MNTAQAQRTKIIVGMSGGVDSSVAALLLLQQDYQVEGLFMKNWEDDDDANYCAAAEDLADASAVCSHLGIRLHSVNFAATYWNRVFKHFLDEYHAGRTPNPDILCNREIKFRAFLDHALALGADKIATGHYCRNRLHDGHWQLLRGVDSNKDQSYFLYQLDAQQLGRAVFPVGAYEKAQIRQLAKNNQLATHDKKDSTGICFIGERRFNEFLQRYLPAQPGDIVTAEGNIIGQHNGLMFYTYGQRKGLGIGGMQDSNAQPWYVAGKDMAHNRLLVVQGQDDALLYHDTLNCSQLHWISGAAPRAQALHAKIRYRQSDQACHIEILDAAHARVTFETAQRAITPGQSIVFYNHDTCLGGGIIDAMFNHV